MHHIIFRSDTWDSNIWNAIVEQNVYGINGIWPHYVIDIGGHIGSFTYFMIERRQAIKSIVLEPDPSNLTILQHNLKPYVDDNRVNIINAGIGLPGHKLCMEHSAGQNTGGIAYVLSDHGTINTMLLDDIINIVNDNTHPILLKLDCEGCEYEALESCSQLHKISCIVGEFHVRNTRNELTLKTLLESQNFAFAYHHTGPDIGLFGAHKLV